ncbi:mitogen-activated protein kinase 7-like [Gigantopelta aegis]|uniref:mitogen-activated protein kinase 7-like n=1 Tax=Gigantopelta aegis TaxID=1735272 RepID=UPI001B8889A2|nr:mitogen-activated protein kinase 7-like [Gigantopelta aegis]XP_041349155.1 mitogen-activated protein kinase 7-like [Gigantopelta aegis]XP_041349156.1 mitogen-activated protein kinase 7-like [Gigantopelta aegis]XP_041349157.1 mitogen-activated protein kinase 7-like [Gigantopelta aegis]
MASNFPLKNKAAMEQFRKNLEKRSLNVKFDLENTDYKALENIGIGAYGVVCSAIHKKTNDKVAIKKIPNVFEALTLTKRTYREIKILKHFKHDNIISIREILKPSEPYKDFKEIYVVFDLMESDLHKIIYTDQDLTEEHIRYFLYQILRGLKYIHSANVIHRDLKPSNLLVNEDCHIRIGDFGMSRGIFYERDEPAFFMTQYVATRWYRAPEILLSLIEYGTGVDMWSVGCIFAEMLGRKHLFPGKDYISQIKLIVGLLGSPSDELLKNCQNVIIRDIIKKLGQRTAIPWKTLFPKASKKAVDLLSKMLVIDPANRISVDKALEHLFLNKYHDPDDEPICVPAFKFDFEKENMDKDILREVIYKEIMEYHQPRTPTFSFNAVLRPAPKSETNPLVLSPCPPIEKKQLDAQLTDFFQTVSCEPSYPDDTGESFSTDDLLVKPEEKKKSPVTVDTSTLLPTLTFDVEMLSAKFSEGKSETLELKPVPIVKKTDKENKPAEVSDTANVTISLGTKARIKQALQNASERRQRTESTGDDGEKKPITAAQRQREREEKRKKKKDRALERKKKVKENKNTTVFILSDADKEMLQRWSQMQQVPTGPTGVGVSNVPLAAAPGQTIIITSLSQTVLQPIVSNVQPQQESTGQIVQPILPATSSVSSVVLSQVVHDSLVHSQTGVLQTKSDIPAGHVISTGHFQCPSTEVGAGSNTANMEHDSVQKPEHQLQSCMFQSAGKSNLPFQTQTSGLHTQTSGLQQQHHIFPQQQQQQQNLFNQMTQNNELCHSQMDQSHQGQSSNSLFSQDSQQLASHSVPPVTSVRGHPAFGQGDASSLVAPATDLQRHAFLQQDATLFHFPQGFSNSRSTCQPDAYSHESGPQGGEFTQHHAEQQGMFAGVGGDPFPPPQPAASTSQQTLLSTSSQQPFTNFTSGSEHVCQTYHNNPSPVGYDPTAAVAGGGVSGRSAWTPANTDQYVQKASLADGHAKHENQLPQEQKTQDRITSPTQRSTNRQPQTLKIKCSPPPRAPEVPANHHDLIALLSKQLMKSGMADPFPPALSLTPKGTGGGYGVGTDLDALMVDAHENIDVNRVEQSPLSSSLIADWLDISGNITQADLEALEHEMEMQSPMSLSYSDFNLHNPP